MRVPSSAAIALSVLGTVLGACAAEVELEERRCPCAAGYACCSARDVCLPQGTACEPGEGGTDLDAASPDASVEAPAGCPALRPRLCGIAKGKENAPLTIEVDGIGPCTVKVNEWMIELTVKAQPPDLGPPRLGCTGSSKTTCTIPPLQERGAGAPYSVFLFRAGVVVGFEEADGSGQLFVRRDGTQESCNLPEDDPRLDLTPYPKACSGDEDCVPISTTLCTPCAAPTEALAASGLVPSGFFDVERARRSECWRRIGLPDENVDTCPDRPKTHAVCNQGTCEVAN